MKPLTRHRKGRRWLVVGCVGVLAGAGVAAYLLVADDNSPAITPATTRTVTASLGTIKHSLSATGTIEPADQDQLNFSASGTVTSVKVAEGDRVKKGAVLATIDSAALKANLAQAKAALASAKSRLTSDEDANASDTQITADQSAVTTAQDEVNSAQQALNGATLKSPIDGVIATVNLAVGDSVSGSSNSNGSSGGDGSANSSSSSSSSAQFLVIGTDSWLVNTSVDSTGVGLISKGIQATVIPGNSSSSSSSGSGFVGGVGSKSASSSVRYGTVTSVGLTASSNSSSSTANYPVVVSLTGKQTGLHAGDTASVSLIYRQLSNVLTVPTQAVTQVNGKSVVYQMVNGKKVAKTVTTGESGGGLTQIKSGLSEGDQVLVTLPGGLSNRGGQSSRSSDARKYEFPGGGQLPPGVDNFGGGAAPGGK